MDKLQLKTKGMRTKKQRMLQQLKQREEVSESLHEVDFHQLHIEHKQHTEKVTEKATEVLRIKASLASMSKILEKHKVLRCPCACLM